MTEPMERWPPCSHGPAVQRRGGGAVGGHLAQDCVPQEYISRVLCSLTAASECLFSQSQFCPMDSLHGIRKRARHCHSKGNTSALACAYACVCVCVGERGTHKSSDHGPGLGNPQVLLIMTTSDRRLCFSEGSMYGGHGVPGFLIEELPSTASLIFRIQS